MPSKPTATASVACLLLAVALALPAHASAFVYWADRGTDSIGRADLDGTSPDQVFIAGASDPCGVAVSGTHVYWANAGAGTISRAALDGSGVDQSFITSASSPCGVAVSATHVYWANRGCPGTAGRASRARSVAPTSMAPAPTRA